MTTIGIIGAGNIGQAVAEAVIARGHDVVIANSRGPETLGDLVARLGDRATAGTIEQAAGAGELVLLAIPLAKETELEPSLFAGKIVIDADNYYPQRDGDIADLADGTETSAGRLQAMLPDARVVKAFNHIMARQIVTDATASGTPGRRALAVFGDDEDARGVVAALIDEVGFDVVDGGALAESWRIQVGQPGYVTQDTAAELRAHLAEATR
ncbi:MAG: NAD(P)-binding domain-containing protein [Micrococcales bacterium]|nr:NAD(P)-binding domain-containing protein [Micrococcales bacterium]